METLMLNTNCNITATNYEEPTSGGCSLIRERGEVYMDFSFSRMHRMIYN